MISRVVYPDEPARFRALAQSLRRFFVKHDRGDGLDLNQLRPWARGAGLRLLGAGSERIVVALDRHRVLKIEASGGDANEVEATIWNTAPANIKRLLVPVLDVDPNGDWLIQTRVTPRTVRDDVPAHWKVLQDWGIGDHQPDNYEKGGRMLDYAWAKPARRVQLGLNRA